MRPATASDALVLASPCTFAARQGYTLVQAPERRDFWFGNALVLDDPPAPGSEGLWLELCAREFAGVPLARLVVSWETEAGAALHEDPRLEGVEWTARTVLELPPATGLAGEPPPGCALEPLRSGEAWAQAAALEERIFGAEPGWDPAFIAWRRAVIRRDCAAGRAAQFAARYDGDLVAFAGAYADEAWTRFLTPLTDVPFRRRGLFGALCARVVNAARERFPRTRVVIAADAGSDPERLYRALGFRAVGTQYALLAKPAPQATTHGTTAARRFSAAAAALCAEIPRLFRAPLPSRRRPSAFASRHLMAGRGHESR